jgi:hypothetical protein
LLKKLGRAVRDLDFAFEKDGHLTVSLLFAKGTDVGQVPFDDLVAVVLTMPELKSYTVMVDFVMEQ